MVTASFLRNLFEKSKGIFFHDFIKLLSTMTEESSHTNELLREFTYTNAVISTINKISSLLPYPSKILLFINISKIALGS